MELKMGRLGGEELTMWGELNQGLWSLLPSLLRCAIFAVPRASGNSQALCVWNKLLI